VSNLRYMPSRFLRAFLPVVVIASLAGAASAGPYGHTQALPPSVPKGFTISVVGVVDAPTSLSFGPTGKTLFVANAVSQIFSLPVLGRGLALGPPLRFLGGLDQPLGVVATNQGVFVSSHMSTDTPQGEVLRARDTNGDGIANSVTPVLTNLPLGAHATNGLALGHDGMMYVANGNANYTGFGAEGGRRDTPPYSGSILRFRPDASNLKPSPSMVVATGFRNPYDLAFFPTHHPAVRNGQNLAAVSMNGPDGGTYNGRYRPVGEDTLSVFDAANATVEHFGFPYCVYERNRGGLAGFPQAPEEGPCNPLPAKAYTGLVGPTVQAKPSVLFGDHVSSDGLAFNPGTNFPSAYNNDLFVAEWGAAGNAGHKVVRVHFDKSGRVASVTDFLTGVLPLDLTFAPDGSLYVADMAGPIYRIAAIR
jgi:glucose/arabinose dehydrogenase